MEEHFRTMSMKTLNAIDFLIDYINLPVSSLTPEQFPIIIKTSSDVLINPSQLMKMVEYLRNLKMYEFLAGMQGQNILFERFHDDKHFMPEYIIPGKGVKGLLHGATYLLSYSAAKQILDYSKCLPAIPYLDDIVLTGILRERLGFATIKMNQCWLISTEEVLDSALNGRNASKYRNIAIYHNEPAINREQYKLLWHYLNKNSLINF